MTRTTPHLLPGRRARRPGRYVPRRALLARVLSFAALGAACTAAPPPLPSPPPDLIIGTWAIREDAVVDGDTLRLPNGERVRILGIDTEEVFRKKGAREAAAEDFDAYARENRGDSAFPVKYGTPMGDAGSRYARKLIRETLGGRMRLERDALGDAPRGTYGRLLGHVVLIRPNGELLFAEEMVRCGLSPHFVKYGRSRRYGARLDQAEEEARRGRRGIWGKGGPRHYPDYEERRDWWRARADQIDRWRAEPASPSRLTLGVPGNEARLRALIGQQVTVFGLVGGRRPFGKPRLFWLRDQPKKDLTIVVFETEVWDALDHTRLPHYYVTVTGEVSVYRDRPQIIVADPAQVSVD